MMQEITVPANATLTREDVPGFDVFIVIEGAATVRCSGVETGRLLPGDVVGETGLPGIGTGRATVTADTPMRLLSSDPATFCAALGLPEIARTNARAISRVLE